jgi:uronate dehydrogenase
MKKVLFLGSSGKVGQSLLEEYFKDYKNDYKIILGFHNEKLEYNLESRKVDLSDLGALKEAMNGIDVVINFAANSNPDAEFSEILEPNIIGAYNVFEAARQTRIKRVIFASSVHSIRGYPIGYEVKHSDITKPLNFYGASKVFGEALCHVFSHKYGMSCLAIRIGTFVPDHKKEIVCYTREYYDYVISQRDLMQLIHKCIFAPDEVKFGILSGISNNKRKYIDLEFTKELVGYKPKDDAFEICEEIKSRDKKR